ncbi:Protein of unknown function [Paenimyroides aquimaris]|uniref:DUF2975 domain-containing protein n=2 Tax=Paenimyroides marinum TaxID=1159016 RepID=A0A1H6MKS2_9FLAO|nr:DUF2975 domain-containing protein [Paenimyroides aquimaris]SEI02335.1 Protein of unknown function [Paenimyroides aquimaris]
MCFDLLNQLELRVPSYRLFGTFYKTSESSLPIYISTILYFTTYTLIILSLLSFYSIIEEFKEQHFFSDKVIYCFKRMGWLLCISFSIKLIIMGSIKYQDDLFVKTFTMGVNNPFEMPIIILIFGLFFLSLSKAFQIAKIQKEENTELRQENELTI